MSDPVTRLNDALEGRYTIERELGEGGMATVYLARDLKHNRSVALKVLKPELAAVLGAERFLAEIETTANLQHPNILPLYDSGEADTFLFYVMPYVEGDTLRERLKTERQLPVDEAVRIITAVANALDFAHRQGVVHRDVKPGNILFQDGQPVLGDFGIALAVGAGGGSRLTETGLSVGTPYYMSPEQATGDQLLGPQSDIYSLGCVLYEALVGDPPYMGSSAQAVLGRIIAGAPVSPTEFRSNIPANLDAAVRKSLEKLPADRFATAKELVSALADPGFRHGEDAVAAGTEEARRWKRIATVLGASSAVLALALVAAFARPAAPEAETRRYVLQAPTADLIRSQLVLTPDGSRVVVAILSEEADLFALPTADDSRIWVRDRYDLDLTPVPGTEGATTFVISPDGTRIAFSVDDELRITPLDGGDAPFKVADLESGNGPGAWGSDGYIYLSSNTSGISEVRRIPETGGEIEVVFDPEAEGDMIHQAQQLLPGGQGLIVTRVTTLGDLSTNEIAVIDLETGDYRLIANGLQARYARSGHILYSTAAARLMAVPFDLERLEATGPPVPIIEGALFFSMSDDGDLLYFRGTEFRVVPEVLWVERDGTEELIDWEFETGTLPSDPALSPDGSRLALVVQVEDTARVFIKDLAGGPVTPLTGGGYQSRPAWSADGRDIGYYSTRLDGEARLWRHRADGSGEPRPVTGPVEERETDLGYGWLDDPTIVTGDTLGLNVFTPGADSVPTVLLEDGTQHENPTLSPDGRWVAYATLVNDESRIFVRPFPDVQSGRYPVSDGEGREPRWSKGGRELLYVRRGVAGVVELIAATVRLEPDFVVESREVLFATQRGRSQLGDGWSYDVDQTGDRFVVIRFRIDLPEVTGHVLVENFLQELREKMGG